jgi:tRNA G10  N-methylase Trm11
MALLDDTLHFASLTLVENGRLAMWMPTANDEDIELAIPTHPCLKVVSVCVQPFNKCKISASPSIPSPFHFYIRMHLSTLPFWPSPLSS